MSLAPLFKWMEGLAVYRSSVYLGPGVNLVHLVSMVTFMGALLVVDLRLMGAALTKEPVKDLAQAADPWLIAGLVGLTVTGIPAVMAAATQEYGSHIFWAKMYILALAMIFTFTVRRWVTQADQVPIGAVKTKIVPFLSIALWMAVAAGGRLIMYL